MIVNSIVIEMAVQDWCKQYVRAIKISRANKME
jgi:hypothetical protein